MPVLKRIGDELGISALASSTSDVYLLLLTRFARMFAYGSSTLILALFFAVLGHSDTQIGLFMTLTLVGDVFISLILTFVADTLGRRRIMILGACLMAISGCVFALTSNYWILLLAAVVGIISPSGNEIGPFRAVEESTLAHLSDATTRSDIFAWYVIAGTLGTALGSLFCGWGTQTLQSNGWSKEDSFRLVFWVYSGIGVFKALVSLFLTRKCEATPEPTPTSAPQQSSEQNDETEPLLASHPNSASKSVTPPSPAPKKKGPAITQISKKSLATLAKLCGLFFFDSLASGMVPGSLIAFFMSRKFGMPEGQLGTIMFASQLASSVGNIFASSVAKRIGLVKTMVFTHLPSAIMLGLLPIPSSLALTIALLVARGTLASMDQAPRSAFLSAVVLPQERTAVMGVVNTVKTMSQSSGPLITGLLAGSQRFWIAFVVAGALKASYDLGLLALFVNTRLEGDKAARAEDTQEQNATEPEAQQASDSRAQ